MLTAKQKKSVAALAEAKHRRREGIFSAEGTKCVADTAGHFACVAVYATEEWLADNAETLRRLQAADTMACTRGDLREMSTLMATPPVIAVYRLPEAPVADATQPTRELIVALDRVQDPGNLGTIIRTADWFGIHTIWASIDTVDAFNPKTIQATMGAISRVRVLYADLGELLREGAGHGADVYGTFLDGENIYTTALGSTGVVVMGNEGQGIGPDAAASVTRRLLIPSYPAGQPTSESLNVATATAITLSEFRRR